VVGSAQQASRSLLDSGDGRFGEELGFHACDGEMVYTKVALSRTQAGVPRWAEASQQFESQDNNQPDGLYLGLCLSCHPLHHRFAAQLEPSYSRPKTKEESSHAVTDQAILDSSRLREECLQAYGHDLEKFHEFLVPKMRQGYPPGDVTREHIRDYLGWLGSILP